MRKIQLTIAINFISSNNNDEVCLMYSKSDNNGSLFISLIVPLNHEEIGESRKRISKVKPYIDKYNWEGINHSSEKDDWKKSEKKSHNCF